MLITIRVRDKRHHRGFKTLTYHENDITPQIYRYVQKNKNKVKDIWSVKFWYFADTKPNVDDFLSDFKFLDK